MVTLMTNDEQVEELKSRLDLRERQLAALHQISAALFSKSHMDQVLQETLHALLDIVDATAGSLLMYDRESRKLVFRHVVGKTELIGMEIDPEQDQTGKAATVFRTGESLLTLDTSKEGHNATFDDITGFKTQSILTVALKNIGGEPSGVLQALNKRHGVFDDDDIEILEIVSGQAATTIENARLAQEAQLAAVARAVGDLGHDVGNALTPIDSAVETLILGCLEPMFEQVDRIASKYRDAHPEIVTAYENAMKDTREEYPYTQGSVKEGCGDITEMVGEIADYVKGTQAVNMQKNDLGKVIRDRVGRLERLAQQRKVALHLEGLEDVPSFLFDRRLLRRAIYNLVNNALGALNDAVKKGTLEYRSQYNIWVRARAVCEGEFPNGNYCQIEVEDDGAGIPSHVKASLFTPNTISTTPGGTGIGTRFVKDVTDRHGGIVGVDSEFGHGAKFWIRLPLNAQE